MWKRILIVSSVVLFMSCSEKTEQHPSPQKDIIVMEKPALNLKQA